MPESKHRKNRSRYQPGKQLSGAAPASTEPPESSESSAMNENERIIEISELTFRQQSVLPIVAVSRSIAQAARDSGVAESTLRSWLSQPPFREELERIRRESCDLARQQAEAVLPACVSAIAEMALEAEDPALRYRALRFLIVFATRSADAGRMSAEIADLRQALDLAGTTAPPT